MKSIATFLVTALAVGNLFTACDTTSSRTNADYTQSIAKQSVSNVADRSAREIRGATPYVEIQNEPAPRLIVDPPLPDMLAQGVVWIQWRVENVRIAPIFGKGALNVSPRIGHLHIQVDDLSWWWADASDLNTIDVAGMLPGPHKVKITLVNANHESFPEQSRTVAFTIPEGARASHSH
jgi:uncharacterized protein DUF6130